MAGEFPGGGAQRFRDAISFVQEMAAAPDDPEQVYFFLPSEIMFVSPWVDDAYGFGALVTHDDQTWRALVAGSGLGEPGVSPNWELVVTEGDLTAPLAADGNSFSPDGAVARRRPDPIHVPCGITYFDRQGEITNIGVVTPTRIALDLLDEHWDQVSTFEFVSIAGDKYVRGRVEPPTGLFDVGIYTVHCNAETET